MAGSFSRRTFLTGLAAVAAAPALPALSHGEYAGEGIIGVDIEAVPRALVMSGLYPYQKTVVALIEAGGRAQSWQATKNKNESSAKVSANFQTFPQGKGESI